MQTWIGGLVLAGVAVMVLSVSGAAGAQSFSSKEEVRSFWKVYEKRSGLRPYLALKPLGRCGFQIPLAVSTVRYEGDKQDGKWHGPGVLTLPGGQRIEGEFRDGKAHGEFVKTWPNGRRHAGKFRDGKAHGSFLYEHAKARRGFRLNVEECREGKVHGQYAGLNANGHALSREYRDGVANGDFEMRNKSGVQYSGEYRDGKLHGHLVIIEAGNIFAAANGARFEARYRDGELVEGTIKLTYTNGKVFRD